MIFEIKESKKKMLKKLQSIQKEEFAKSIQLYHCLIKLNINKKNNQTIKFTGKTCKEAAKKAEEYLINEIED